MKKNIAYKVAKDVDGLPDGAITEQVETDDDALEGYTVVSRENFTSLMLKNRDLLLDYQNKVHADLPVAANRAEPISADLKKEQQKTATDDAALFAQFLAWKNAQSST